MNSSVERAKPFLANEAIDYSSQSVVSKTILKTASGNISLFSFDTGEGLSEHNSPHEAYIQILDGSAEIIIDGKSHNVQKGESIILPANIPHALKANEAFKMILVMIKG